MSWQILLAVSIFTEVVGRILHRVLMREDKSDPVAYAILFQIIGGIFVGIFVLIKGFSLPPLEPIWLNLLLMPFLWALANILTFKALKVTEASVFTILFSSNALWMIVGALVFFHETFLVRQMLGALLVITSIVLVSWKHTNIKLEKKTFLTLVAAFVFACALLNDTYIVRTFDVPSFFTFGFILPALIIWVVYPSSTKEMIRITKDKAVLLKITGMSLAFAIAGVGFYYAYVFGRNAAQISSIFQISTVLTVLASIFLLKEKSHLFLKIGAALISFVGILLLR